VPIPDAVNQDAQVREGTEGLTVARRWWPLFGMFSVVLLAQNVLLAGYDPTGHAADHLGSATIVFPAVALVGTLLWAMPTARRQLDVVAACVAWLLAVGGVTLGNLRVVDAIGDANWSDEQADVLGAGLPGFESGHDLAQVASLVAVGAAIVLSVVLFLRTHVGRRVAIGACLASLLFPPWLFPGAGVVVLAIAACFARRRWMTAADPPRPQ
jgi:hypothetical protein